MKEALVEELSNGHFRLLQSGNPSVPVCAIEFNNRKAARNWARGRGYIVADTLPNGDTSNGLN